MSVCRVFFDRAVRTTVLLACLLAWTPVSGGEALLSGGDAKSDLRARNETAIISPPAERGTLTITGASVGGQAAAGVALSF
jgi:hypothetical protein